MGLDIERLLILGGVAESMFDEQLGVEKQHDGVIKRGTADTEVLLAQHDAVEGFDVKMSVNGIDSIEYGKTLGCLAMFIDTKILGKQLFDSIFYIVHVLTNS